MEISKKEELVLDWLRNQENNKYIILDIGANKGFYSESLVDKLDDKIEKIYAFEPVKENYEQYLSKFVNNDKIEIFNKACSDKNEDVEFYQLISNDVGIEGLSSISYRDTFKNLNYNKIIVECVIIDEFLKIDSECDLFVKIDVEGHELEVMLGMIELFKSNKIACLQFEYGNCMLERNKNLNDIIVFLNKFNNYQLCDFNIVDEKFFNIDVTNIDKYINEPWNNLYIMRK